MPFSEFTIENLAGDLMPNATVDQQVASGFNRCNITTSEGGAIDEEYLVLYARDRVETTCVAWMGLAAAHAWDNRRTLLLDNWKPPKCSKYVPSLFRAR